MNLVSRGSVDGSKVFLGCLIQTTTFRVTSCEMSMHEANTILSRFVISPQMSRLHAGARPSVHPVLQCALAEPVLKGDGT